MVGEKEFQCLCVHLYILTRGIDLFWTNWTMALIFKKFGYIFGHNLKKFMTIPFCWLKNIILFIFQFPLLGSSLMASKYSRILSLGTFCECGQFPLLHYDFITSVTLCYYLDVTKPDLNLFDMKTYCLITWSATVIITVMAKVWK